MTVPRIVLIAAALAGGVGLTALTAPEVKSQAPPARPREPLVNLVKQSIERGVQFLRDQERGQGHWENIPDLIFQFPMKGGPTALALLALLNSGVKPDDPIIERAKSLGAVRHLIKADILPPMLVAAVREAMGNP